MFTHKQVQIPLIKDITLPDGRRYYITPDGEKYPSVTTVLGANEKPWLIQWQAALGKDKAKKETKRCADRGTIIHKLAEAYLDNKTVNTKKFLPVHIADFNKLKLHLNKINNIRSQEVALYSDQLKIAGRVDCVAEYNGTLSIVDFKTSTNNKTEQMIEDYFLQCTAYAIMWHELTNESIDNIVVLISVEKGVFPLVFVKSIDKYISPLLKRIHEYHRRRK